MPGRLLRLPWALAVLALSAALAGGCDILRLLPTPGPAADTRVAPQAPLPAPYDFPGIQRVLADRGTMLSPPTRDALGRARVAPEAFAQGALRILAALYPGETVEIVSIHVAFVDIDDPRFPIRRRLSYVVETTGHSTGNCFALIDADTGDGYLEACFYADRSRPGR
jgi:hypothetical protein